MTVLWGIEMFPTVVFGLLMLFYPHRRVAVQKHGRGHHATGGVAGMGLLLACWLAAVVCCTSVSKSTWPLPFRLTPLPLVVCVLFVVVLLLLLLRGVGGGEGRRDDTPDVPGPIRVRGYSC